MADRTKLAPGTEPDQPSIVFDSANTGAVFLACFEHCPAARSARRYFRRKIF
jgi:hypothetical protein